jgi:hypothetical protein
MGFSTLCGYGRATMLAAALAALPLLAQMSQDQPSQAGQFRYGSQYNQGTETTVEGTILSVNPQAPGGMHVTLDTDRGQYDVHLGPQWYLDQQQVSLNPGDRIQVTGSEQMIGGQPSVIARQVTENGNTVTLRTASGIPLWSGAAQRGFQAGQQGQAGPYTGQPGQYQQIPSQQGPYMGQPGQPQQRQMGTMNGQQRGTEIYNPFTETTLTGTVQEVKQCACGPFSGTFATLNTNQGRIAVQLAPHHYLSRNQIQIKRGDQIQVTGSRLNVNGNDVLLARLISTGQRTVALRTPQGSPQWIQTGQFGQQQPLTDGPPETDEDEEPEF